jgi:DNA-binding response OmpR family regulator
MLTKTKILAIGSDPLLTRLLEQELGDSDYEVASVQHTGISLKDVLHKEPPDFIILDIMMPTLDGIEICLHLRQWTQVPIMMLTTWGTGGSMVRGLNLGSESYLTEPFGIDQLKERINDTLQRNAAVAGCPANINTSTSCKEVS